MSGLLVSVHRLSLRHEREAFKVISQIPYFNLPPMKKAMKGHEHKELTFLLKELQQQQQAQSYILFIFDFLF